MDKMLYDIKELSGMMGVSARQVWRMRDAGHLPQPLKIGGNKCLRWSAATIQEWISDGAPHVRRTGWTAKKDR